MKPKIILALLAIVFLLSACGEKSMDGKMVLLNQDKEEITFPQVKPTLFFFMTTYT